MESEVANATGRNCRSQRRLGVPANAATDLPWRPSRLHENIARAETLACVIMTVYHDNMIRTQISFDEDLYERAKSISKQQGISLSELCRRGLAALLAKEPTQKPWMAYVGRFQGRKDDSHSIDDVVYDRETP